MIGCATGLGVVAAALARSRRQHGAQAEPITAPPAAPARPTPAPAASSPQWTPIRQVLVHAPDPLAEPVARLEAEMALSAVIVTAELRAPRPGAAAVLDRPPKRLPEPAVKVATVFPVEVEPSLRLDEFMAVPAVAQPSPRLDEFMAVPAVAQPSLRLDEFVEVPVVVEPALRREEFVEVPAVVDAPHAEPSPSRRREAAWLLGAIAAVGLLLCIVLLAVGSQAPGVATRYPMRNVVGMQAGEARAMLARDGVQISTVPAGRGPVGVVLRETGFDADGMYGPGSQIVLLVGGS